MSVHPNGTISVLKKAMVQSLKRSSIIYQKSSARCKYGQQTLKDEDREVKQFHSTDKMG